MNTENLTKLAHFLMTVPDENFLMQRYVDAPIEKQEQARAENYCNSAACALGWAAVLFRQEASAFKESVSAHKDIQVLNYNAMGDSLFKLSKTSYMFCFSGHWDVIDNTARGAAARILYVVNGGSLMYEDEKWSERGTIYIWRKLQDAANAYLKENYPSLGDL